MLTLVCRVCGNLLEVKEEKVLESCSEAVIRKGSSIKCESCKKIFFAGESLVLEYELGNHSTPLWVRRKSHI
jgi:uncharacterized protein with PIN domain